MAAYNVRTAKSATLVAATVDTVTLTGGRPVVEIVNRATAATDLVWFTVGVDDETPADPSAAGDNVHFCPANTRVLYPAPPGSRIKVVKLISAQTPAYTVQAFYQGTR